MSQVILCISGKKKSGKNTSANFLYGRTLVRKGLFPYYGINSNGKLVVPFANISGDQQDMVLDIESQDIEIVRFLYTQVWGHIKTYSFADKLKSDVCIGILGLTFEQCYGTDEEKNTLTNLYWENMPGVTTTEPGEFDVVKSKSGRLGEYYKIINDNLIYHPPGQMTAREVMQFVGTGIFRKMYSDVWVDATLRQIKQDGSDIAVITDGRFANEILGVKNAGGYNIRLTRNVDNDQHESEIALDPDKFDWKNFDIVVDNQNLTIDETLDEIGPRLDSLLNK